MPYNMHGVMKMSNREKAIDIINQIPEYKLTYVVDVLKGIKNMLIEETEPDNWDLQMIAEAKEINDGSSVTFEEILKKDGLTYADLQD